MNPSIDEFYDAVPIIFSKPKDTILLPFCCQIDQNWDIISTKLDGLRMAMDTENTWVGSMDTVSGFVWNTEKLAEFSARCQRSMRRLLTLCQVVVRGLVS